MNLENKVALVTGGTKGIGLAIVEAFAKAQMKVCFTARTAEDVKKIEHQFSDPNIYGTVVDVRDHEAMAKCINDLNTKYGQIDIIIANAGIGHFASIEDMSYEQWNDVIDINLTGVFNTIKPSIALLKKTKGYIITIASLAGTNFFAKGGAYNASKFGLVGFTQAIMLDLRKYGIKVSTIMPGSVSTYFNGHTPSASDDWKIQAEDIAQITVDLLKMPPNALPSKVEVRPSMPPSK